jgi:hypothetical protein
VGFLGFVLLARDKKERVPAFWPDTLGEEAHLTLAPLERRLAEKLGRLHPQSCQDALAEVAFYTAQLREVRAIAACRDPSPGRGYVGFDVYGGVTRASASSWSRYAL